MVNVSGRTSPLSKSLQVCQEQISNLTLHKLVYCEIARFRRWLIETFLYYASGRLVRSIIYFQTALLLLTWRAGSCTAARCLFPRISRSVCARAWGRRPALSWCATPTPGCRAQPAAPAGPGSHPVSAWSPPPGKRPANVKMLSLCQ